MDRKIDAGSLLVAGAALLLVIALFLDWFGDGSVGLTAWEAFEVLDLVLLAAAGAAVAAAFGRLDSRVLVGAAVVAVVVVASQLIEPPPAGQGADREVGAWLGLVGALGLLAGAALTAAKIAVTVDVRGRERRQRVAAVDKRDGAARPAAPEPSVVDRFAPESADRPTGASADRDGSQDEPDAHPARGGSRAADPDATQPFAATPPDTPAS